MNHFYRLLVFILLLAAGCKAPRPKYLVKDGGNWDIKSMQYRVGDPYNIDTTFSNAGEVHFEWREEDEPDYERYFLEGHMIAPAFSILDGQPTFLNTTMFFMADARTGLMIENDIGFWNFRLENWEVAERTKTTMQWDYSTWDGLINVTYNLERR